MDERRECVKMEGNNMGYRLNLKNGMIHSNQEICSPGKRMKEGTYKDYKTLNEARETAKEKKKKPVLCKRCEFREDLQREIDL